MPTPKVPAVHDALGWRHDYRGGAVLRRVPRAGYPAHGFTDGEGAGSWSVRFCSFNHRGAFQRSPLMGEENIEAMREALKKTPRLREILRRMVE
jgi:hypothetical protein